MHIIHIGREDVCYDQRKDKQTMQRSNQSRAHFLKNCLVVRLNKGSMSDSYLAI